MLFDSHLHFTDEVHDTEIRDVMERAWEAGLGRATAIGGNASLNGGALKAARLYPERVGLALGYDRDTAPELAASEDALGAAIADLRGMIEEARSDGLHVGAVGEAGLDFHYHPETEALQVRLLRAELALAREQGLPVVIHSRDAQQATLDLLAEHAQEWSGPAERLGVIHCFTYDTDMARRFLEQGYFISFSGIVSFRNADALREAAAAVPDNRLLIETDSPYLAPVPQRGKRNEPAFVRHVAECLADVRGVTVAHVAAVTSQNAERLFGLQKD